MKEKFKKNPLIFIAGLQVLFLLVLLIAMFARKNEGFVISGDRLNGGITEYMPLSPGSYEVTMQYHTDTDDASYQIFDSTYVDNAMNGDLIGNFDQAKTMQKVPFWLYHKTDTFYVAWSENANMECITVRKTNALFAEWILSFVLFFLVLDFILYRFIKSAAGDKKEIKKNKIAAAIFVTTVVVSLPLMINYLLDARGDISFHLARIEGIYEGLRGGSFPVRMDGFMLQGQGYADPIFYPNLFLYIPAFFRLIGLPVLRAYKLFIGLWNLFTCVLAYYSFKQIVKSDKAALTGMILYVLSPYRVLCLYGRGAVGEALAMSFFPLVAAGLWLLLKKGKESIKEKGKADKKPFFERRHIEGLILLALGLSGILQSHILSCEMIGVFMILTLLICIKRTVRLKTFLSLCISAVLVILLNLWFLIPFLQSYGMDLYVFENFDVYLYENALTLYQIFGPQMDLYGQSSLLMSDLTDEMGMSLGLAIVFGILVTVWNVRRIGSKRKTDIGKLVPVAGILGTFAAWITTYFFPWKQIENLPVVGKLFGMVQFPWRYLGISGFCFVLMIVAYLEIAGEAKAETSKTNGEAKEKSGFIGCLNPVQVILIGLAVLVAYFNYQSLMDQTEYFAPYSEVGVNQGRTMIQAEYLFTDTTIAGLRSAARVDHDYSKSGSVLTFTIDEAKPEAWELATPMTFYPYYVAKDINTGEQLYTAKGSMGTAVIFVPGGYSGTIKFYVPEAKKWILGDVVSLLTLIGMIVFCVFYKKRLILSDDRKSRKD